MATATTTTTQEVNMTSTTTPVGPSSPGALGGFENRCECGDVARYSLETLARHEAASHQAWHQARAAKVSK
jgi:hypothetical protein